MNVSSRINNLNFSEIRKLIPLADKVKKSGTKVYHLNIGQPDIHTPKEFFNGVKSYGNHVLKYENSQGLECLIDSCITYYKKINIDFHKDDIYITNGGSEAILFALLTICDFGDTIIVPEPYYSNYNNMAAMAGVEIISFRTYREDGFHIKSKNQIVQSIRPNTRAIFLSNPGNPTGVVYTIDEMRLICDVAKEYNLFIIADEVYREFIYDDIKYTSFMHMEDVLDRVILIDSISKRYSACGARVGMLACKNKKVSTQFLKLCQSRLSVASLDQLGAANLINVDNSYFKSVNKEYEKRRDILYSGLTKIEGVECKKPSGAFYIIAKLPINDSNEFAKWLLTDFNYNNKTLLITPANGFYSSNTCVTDEVRLSYCINSSELTEAVKLLNIALRTYKNKLTLR